MSVFRAARNFFHELRHPRDLFACLSLFFKMGFLFALLPFHVNESRVLSASYFGYANIILRILFFNYCYIRNFCCEPSMVSFFFQTHLSQVTAAAQKLNGAIALNFIIGISLLKSPLFKRIIEEFHCLECRFTNCGTEINQTASAIRINAFILFLMALNVVFVYSTLCGIFLKNGCTISLTSAFSFYSQGYIATAFILLFGGVLLKLSVYFEAIYKFLENLNRSQAKGVFVVHSAGERVDTPANLNVVIPRRTLSESIQETIEIHQLIFQAADKANEFFTYQLLTIISNAFLIIVFDAYYVLETLLGVSERQQHFTKQEFLTFFAYQMSLYIIVIISIVESSSRVIEKSEKTGAIVHQLLANTRDADAREKLHQFSAQLLHLKVKFSAAGFFNSDRTLYFTICGALTTYLIILLQVSASTTVTLGPENV